MTTSKTGDFSQPSYGGGDLVNVNSGLYGPADGATGNSRSTGDSTYAATNDTLEAISRYIEQAVHTAPIDAATGLADALPGMIPDDSETVGHVADAAAALARAQADQAAALDAIQAAKNSHEANFRAGQEAADSTGHVAERQYHTAG